MASLGTQSGARPSQTAPDGTNTVHDPGSQSSPSAGTSQASHALEKAQQAKLLITRRRRLPADELADPLDQSFDKTSDMFTAMSDETRSVVFPKSQIDPDLPVLWWDPFSKTPNAFLLALSQCLKKEITEDDFKTYTMIVAPSTPTHWKEYPQEKYGSIQVVFDERLKERVTMEQAGKQSLEPYSQSLWDPSARAVGYVIEPSEGSTWEFKCWVVETF